MAIKHIVSLLLVSLAIFFQGSEVSARDTIFTLKNLCSDKIWPGTLAGNNGAVLGGGGFSLAPGASNQFPAPAGWSGRFWGRTGCKFDGSGNGKCSTGDCGNKLNCTGSGGVPPVTLAEFTIGSGSNHFMDFYDVSLVDGYNVGIGIRPSNGSGDCKYAGCVADLNANCPPELEVTSVGSGVACKSACTAFNTPEYCCTGDHATPATCPPTQYSKLFKQACLDAYSYAYDDETSTFTCSVMDYLITFCPSGTQWLQMENTEKRINSLRGGNVAFSSKLITSCHVIDSTNPMDYVLCLTWVTSPSQNLIPKGFKNYPYATTPYYWKIAAL